MTIERLNQMTKDFIKDNPSVTLEDLKLIDVKKWCDELNKQ